MAENLPEGVANLDDYRDRVKPGAVEGGTYEHVELGDYATEKARATLEVAKIIEDVEFPDDDFEILLACDKEKLTGYREALYSKMSELAFDKDGKVQNDSRFIVEYMGLRLAVLDELLSVRSSEDRAYELFEKIEMKAAA